MTVVVVVILIIIYMYIVFIQKYVQPCTFCIEWVCSNSCLPMLCIWTAQKELQLKGSWCYRQNLQQIVKRFIHFRFVWNWTFYNYHWNVLNVTCFSVLCSQYRKNVKMWFLISCQQSWMFKIVETARSTGHSAKRVKFLENFKTFLYKTWKESRNANFKQKKSG